MRKCSVENEAYLLTGLDSWDTAPARQFGPLFKAIHFIHAKADYLYHVHRHADFEMIIPLKGVYKCLLNSVPLALRPGKALLIQPGDIHQDIYQPGMEYCGSIFKLEMPEADGAARRIFKAGMEPQGQIASFKSLKSLLRARKILSEKGSMDSAFPQYMASAILQAILWEILAEMPKRSLSAEFLCQPERDVFRKRLLRLFEENARSPFNLDDMAQAMGMSRSGLSHKCAELLGTPPAKAFLDFRLEKARRLIQESSANVKEACLALGFANQFHFSRAFKRRFGFAPSGLR